MQNDFERQVQQKMEELDLVPSAPVWEKIELQIREKKDRRRYVLWLFLILFVAGGGVTWLINQSAQNPSPAKTASQDQTDKTKNSEIFPSTSENSTTVNPPVQQKENTSIKENRTGNETETSKQRIPAVIMDVPGESPAPISATSPFSITAKKKIKNPRSYISSQREIVSPATLIPKSNPALSHKTTSSSKLSDKDFSSTDKVPVETGSVKPTTPSSEKSSLPVKKTPDTAAGKKQDTLHAVVTTEAINTNDLIAANTPPAVDSSSIIVPDLALKKPRSSKWQFGFEAGIGISGLGKGINFSQASMNKTLHDAFPQAAVSYSRVPYSRDYTPPSVVKKNVSFSLGAVVKKAVGKRLQVSSGVGYEQYSTLLESGKTDSTLVNFSGNSGPSASFRAGGSFRNYNNIFHFITVPLNLHFQVFKKTPLNVYGGVAVKHMVATTGMEYNQFTSSYSRDIAAYNNTQMYTNLGFEYAVLNKKNQFLVGPEITYGITKHLNTGSPQHLYSIGIKAEFLFQKD